MTHVEKCLEDFESLASLDAIHEVAQATYESCARALRQAISADLESTAEDILSGVGLSIKDFN